MERKVHTQKNTLLKNAQADTASNFFKRVFFSPTQEETQIIFFATLRFFNYLFFQSTMRNRKDIALNVNRFEQSVCGLQKTHLRTDRRAAANIRLKEILKKGAVTVIRTVVLVTNSGGYTNSRASNPPF